MKLIEKGKWFLFVATVALFATACDKDDPNYDDVTPPAVEVTHSLSGRVTAMSGDGLVATVTMGTETKTTAADGTFLFENVKAGTYALKAEATGKKSKEGSVTISGGEKSDNQVWSVTLNNVGTSVKVNDDGSAQGSVVSETTKGNEAAKVDVEIEAPAGAVPAGKTIITTPLYSLQDVTKATESVLLIGTDLTCSDPAVTLAKPIQMIYDLEPEVAAAVKVQKQVGGQWVAAAFSVDGGKVTVTVDQFTSYIVFFDVDITSSTSSEPLSFSPNNWDNLFGSKEMAVATTSYSFKIGTEISSTSAANRTTAYLKEILARRAGAGYMTATGHYNMNVTLPIGTALTVSGQQSVRTLKASALGQSASGKQYGNVTVSANTYNRNHTGGSN
ncbi:hypothetical protein M2137_001696 [Parabacteroides sp. PFB2-10]|uniref:carboxypeptidase-like regulatory domain-containing protein n=1 Tax=Parabacteroides sp. PFB2-10 TaxID=1742405 RepID=UPI0024766DD6|nr:carboxypeptidase-like regulatory domain-containing protein [Parabacteroides sp. PFB2-10]MDH6312911.1 hypothetical protein [Parabacteroides sp. PFB2-10]